MTTATHKRGDTFDRSGAVTITVDGVSQPNLTGWSGRCQIRGVGDVLIAEPVFEWLDSTQALCRLRVPPDPGTGYWPVGMATIDIEFTSPSGDVVSTETVQLQIVKDVTYGS